MLKKLLQFVLTGFGMFALASTTDKWTSKLRPKNLIISGRKAMKFTSIIMLFKAVFILSLTPAKADHISTHSNSFYYKWLSYWDSDWSRTYTSHCIAQWDNVDKVMVITHNTLTSKIEQENAEAGCEDTLTIAPRILQDKIYNKVWSQGALWGNFTGTHDAWTNVSTKINFLEYGDDTNFAVWFSQDITDWKLTSVLVNRLANRPTRGTVAFNGHVGFGNFGHREDLRFATVDFENDKITINAAFEGFKRSVMFQEYHSITSAPLSIGENGYFEGELVETYNNIAGQSFRYKGVIHGFVGGDGGNFVVALYAMQGSGPAKHLIGFGR